MNGHELFAFVYIFVECTLPRQSPIANRVLQRKLIDRHAMIFMTTYFRTTAMADVNLRKTRNKSGLDYDYGEMSLSLRRQVGIGSDLLLMSYLVGVFIIT